MYRKIVVQLWKEHFGNEPEYVKRCAVGWANYVYIVECKRQRYTIRCSTEKDAYKQTIYWLKRLSKIRIPVPKIIEHGEY